MKISTIFALIILLNIPLTANAGVMLEPWLGYGLGKLKCTDTSGNDCGAKANGVHYGGRVGYKMMLGLWFAGEYDGSTKISSKSNVATGFPDEEIVHTSLGLTVGFDTIIGLRAFAGYNFQDKIAVTGGDPTASDTDYTGNSTKFGVGYKFPMIPLAVNVEMVNATYKKYKSADGTSGSVSDFLTTFKTTATIISVSAPFDF